MKFVLKSNTGIPACHVVASQRSLACGFKFQAPSQIEWVERLNIQYPIRHGGNIQPMKGRRGEVLEF